MAMAKENSNGPASVSGAALSQQRMTAKPTEKPDEKAAAKPTEKPDEKAAAIVTIRSDDWDQDDPRASDSAKKLIGQSNREAGLRLAAACLFGLGGPIVVWCILSSSVEAIEQLVRAPRDTSERIVIASMIAHAIVSIAAVYFGYTMLRAAERLFVPQRLLRDKQDVEVIRAILGIDTPSNAIASQAKAGANEIVELVGKLSRAMRGGNDKDDSK